MRDSGFRLLREHLFALRSGAIAEEEVRRLERLLVPCWWDFRNARAEGMQGHKLLNRMEDARWDPPVLSFAIERHGGTAQGSTRAELHQWSLDIDKRTAECVRGKYRQVDPRAAPVKVEPIARELADTINARRSDPRLKWKNETEVRVVMRAIFPSDQGFRQTVTGRRKRLHAALEPLLAGLGWRELRRDLYIRDVEAEGPPQPLSSRA